LIFTCVFAERVVILNLNLATLSQLVRHTARNITTTLTVSILDSSASCCVDALCHLWCVFSFHFLLFLASFCELHCGSLLWADSWPCILLGSMLCPMASVVPAVVVMVRLLLDSAYTLVCFLRRPLQVLSLFFGFCSFLSLCLSQILSTCSTSFWFVSVLRDEASHVSLMCP
jgi:hypothetical protein